MKNLLSLSCRAAFVGAAVLSIQFSTFAEDAIPEAKKDQKAPHWESSAAAGLTLTRGNSDTLSATATATTAKKWDSNELTFGADGTYGSSKINGVTSTTANQIHGFGQYNRLFTERLYGYARLDGLHDDIADIRYRMTLSLGAGYYVIKTTNTDLSFEVGPGYVSQKLGDVTKNYMTLRFGEKFHHNLTEHARIWQTAELLPQVDDFNNYIVNFEIGIEADLSKSQKLTLRTYLDDTYNNVPAPGRKKNDAKLVTAIAYKF